jgi:hypothetical protein
VIRFSAILVAAAIAVLVTGVLASSVALVYASIGASVLAAVLLAAGVWLRRGEIFGAGSARAVRQPAWPAPEGAGTPAMVGGRARISGPGARTTDSPAAVVNGDGGAQTDQDAKSRPRKVARDKSAANEAGAAKAGPARPGPRIGGGYSGAHSSGRGRPTTAPPGRRGPTAPGAGTAARNPGAAPAVPASGDAGPPRPGTPTPDRSASSAGPADGPLDRAGAPAQDGPGNESADGGGRSPARAEASPTDQAAAAQPVTPAPQSSHPADDVPAGVPSAQLPVSPAQGWLSPHGSGAQDDFWDRVSEELDAASTQHGPTAPPRAAAAESGAVGTVPGDTEADALAADTPPAVPGMAEPAPEQSSAGQRWTAWATAGSGRPTSSSPPDDVPARAEDGAHDRASGPTGALEPGDHGGMADREEEEEEAAPSPWSIPLTYVGNLDDLEEEDDWSATGAERESEGPPADELSAEGDLGAADEVSAGDELAVVGDPDTAQEPGQADSPADAGGPADADDQGDGSGHRGEPPDEEEADGEPAAPTGAGARTSLTDDDADAGKPAGTRGSGEDEAEAGQAEDQVPTPAAEKPAADSQDEPGDPEPSSDGDRTTEAGGDRTPSEAGGDRTPSAAGGDRTPSADGAAASSADGGQAMDDEVMIVPGVARYHRTGCILIRFLGSEDLETSTRRAAEADGCIPCRACEPDKPLSAEHA